MNFLRRLFGSGKGESAAKWMSGARVQHATFGAGTVYEVTVNVAGQENLFIVWDDAAVATGWYSAGDEHIAPLVLSEADQVRLLKALIKKAGDIPSHRWAVGDHVYHPLRGAGRVQDISETQTGQEYLFIKWEDKGYDWQSTADGYLRLLDEAVRS